MADLKESWKETGKGLGNAFADLGKTLVKTATFGIKKVDEWANSDDTEKKKDTIEVDGKETE